MARIVMAKPIDNGGGNWTPLPQGTYDVQISECSEAGVSEKGYPKIKVAGEVVGGPYAMKKTSQFFTLSDKSTWNLTNLLDAAGVQYDEEAEGMISFDTDDLLGVYVSIGITTKDYQGKQYNDWKTFKASKLSVGTEPVVQAPAQTLPATPAVQRQQRQAAPAQQPVATTQQVVAGQQVAQAAAPAATRRARA